MAQDGGDADGLLVGFAVGGGALLQGLGEEGNGLAVLVGGGEVLGVYTKGLHCTRHAQTTQHSAAYPHTTDSSSARCSCAHAVP